MTYFNGMFYHLKRHALVEGSTRFKEMHHSCSRELFKVFLHVLTSGFDPTMSISTSVLHIHWLPMFLDVLLHEQTKLPNLCPKPTKLPLVMHAFSMFFYIVFYMFFTWFSNGTTGPTQTIKSTESTFATPIVGKLAKS